eukprot:gene12778-8716_t
MCSSVVTIPKWLRGLTRNQLRSRAQVRILLVTFFVFLLNESKNSKKYRKEKGRFHFCSYFVAHLLLRKPEVTSSNGMPQEKK